MTLHSTRLAGSSLLAEGTRAFTLDRPAGFEFAPGQAVELVLADAREGEALQDVSHAFSLVSAPHESQLVLATRMRDSVYKNRLAALPAGSSVRLDGPFGSALVPPEGERPLVMIAGGIGITPFISILRHAARQGWQRPLLLLYANRHPQEAAFLDELQQLARQLPEFRLVATMTRMDDADDNWDGPRGYLDEAAIRDLCAGLQEPLYLLSGPPALVENTRDLLEDAGVDDDAIRSESFTGY